MDSFFGIGLPELILILLIAGVVMGPERIGVAARWLGRTTAQLQAISRSFVRQLNAELDNIQEADEIKGAMRDMQDLRRQVDQLKHELLSVTNGAVREGKESIAQVQQELEHSIAPPTKSGPPAQTGVQASVPTFEDLPSRLEVPDDPEP